MIPFLWLAFSFAVPYFAGADVRKIGFWWGFVACLLLSPLIGLLIILLSDEDKPIEQRIIEQSKESSISKADELAKFKKLLDDGAINQDEYDYQKMKILYNK